MLRESHYEILRLAMRRKQAARKKPRLHEEEAGYQNKALKLSPRDEEEAGCEKEAMKLSPWGEEEAGC